MHTKVAKQFKAPTLSNTRLKPGSSAAAAQNNEDAVKTGIDLKDIELIMTQARVLHVFAPEPQQ